MTSESITVFGYVLQYGAAAIACCAAYYTAMKANKAANGAVQASKAANEISERNLKIEIAKERIKLRETRISSLLEKFSEFSAISTQVKSSPVKELDKLEVERLSGVVSQIILLLDRDDPDFSTIAKRMTYEASMMYEHIDETKHTPTDSRPFVRICQDILSREYKKLDALLSLEKNYNAKYK